MKQVILAILITTFSSISFASTTYFSDGTWARTDGNVTYYSDGSFARTE